MLEDQIANLGLATKNPCALKSQGRQTYKTKQKKHLFFFFSFLLLQNYSRVA